MIIILIIIIIIIIIYYNKKKNFDNNQSFFESDTKVEVPEVDTKVTPAATEELKAEAAEEIQVEAAVTEEKVEKTIEVHSKEVIDAIVETAVNQDADVEGIVKASARAIENEKSIQVKEVCLVFFGAELL